MCVCWRVAAGGGGRSYSAGICKLTIRGIALIYFPLICFFYIVRFVLPSKLFLF